MARHRATRDPEKEPRGDSPSVGPGLRARLDAYSKSSRPSRAGVDPALKGFIKETSRDAGYRKAARFLVLLGKEEAAKVLRHLSPKEVEGITREIALMENIDQHEASKVMEEFGIIRETRELAARGGLERAEEMLVASVGREKAEKILGKVRKDMAPPPFSFLADVDFHQTVALLRDESAPAIALVMAHLDPRLAARILSALSPLMQKDVVHRIAIMAKVSGDVVRRVEETLRGKIRTQGNVATRELNGKAALTEILRFLDPAREQAILQELEPNTANEIRRSLFTMDVIFRIADKELQLALRDYPDREIAIMLGGLEDLQRERILASVSERRRDSIRCEAEAAKPLSPSQARAARDDLLGYLQVLEQKGDITILRENEPFV